MLKWAEAHEQSKLTKKMIHYYHVKIYSKIVPEWRKVVAEKSKKRQKLFFVKRAL
jgi:hypothetical protein